MKVSINFRDEFDEFQRDYGFYILFQRIGKEIHCRCWNEKYQEGDSKCPICWGSGWTNKIERHQVLNSSAVQSISRPDLNQQTTIGRMRVDAQNIYMRYDVFPQTGDFIYKVGWQGNRPTNLNSAYRVSDIYPVRGDNGRIEFWMLSVKSETSNLDFKSKMIRALGPIKNYTR